MSKLISVGYCGKKESQDDNNVAGTGLVWFRDQKTVHELPEHIANKFLVHTDSWYAVSEREADQPVVIEAREKEKDNEEIFANVNLPAMTKVQLVQYAQRSFGVKLDGDLKKDVLIDKVTNLQKQHTAADK